MAPHTFVQPELLTSWKEIANYLGKGVRTVQRWEIQFGLPVRRPNEKVKGIVHATRQELDRWLEVQWSQRPKDDSPVFTRLDGDHREVVRANLMHASRLRAANRLLLEDIRACVNNMYQECEALSRHVTVKPKTN
jgi:hypothetical protein